MLELWARDDGDGRRAKLKTLNVLADNRNHELTEVGTTVSEHRVRIEYWLRQFAHS